MRSEGKKKFFILKVRKCQVSNDTESPSIEKKVLVSIIWELFAGETWQSTLSDNPREFEKGPSGDMKKIRIL